MTISELQKHFDDAVNWVESGAGVIAIVDEHGKTTAFMMPPQAVAQAEDYISYLSGGPHNLPWEQA